MKRYLEFNMPEVIHLRNCYLETMASLLEQLPDLNWNSRVEVKDYFAQEHKFYFESLQIKYLEERLARTKGLPAYEDAKTIIEILEVFIEYLKLKYLVRNYLECIIRHAVTDYQGFDNGGVGRVELREMNGEWLMPNRQPLPKAKEILECQIGEVTEE